MVFFISIMLLHGILMMIRYVYSICRLNQVLLKYVKLIITICIILLLSFLQQITIENITGVAKVALSPESFRF